MAGSSGADRAGGAGVGGDVSGPASCVGVSCGADTRDGGARAGDQLYVSGYLGDAAAALAFIKGVWQPAPDYAQYLFERFYRLIVLASEMIRQSQVPQVPCGVVGAQTHGSLELHNRLFGIPGVVQHKGIGGGCLRAAGI